MVTVRMPNVSAVVSSLTAARPSPPRSNVPYIIQIMAHPILFQHFVPYSQGQLLKHIVQASRALWCIVVPHRLAASEGVMGVRRQARDVPDANQPHCTLLQGLGTW